MSPEWNAILYQLLDASFRVSVFAAMVALILAVARVRSNSVRHAAWTTVLLAMLLMPVLPYVLPSIHPDCFSDLGILHSRSYRNPGSEFGSRHYRQQRCSTGNHWGDFEWTVRCP